MGDFSIIEHIKELCQQRGWTYYKLAKESGIPHSSLNSILNKQHIPSINNLMKMCDGFGITLAQFFAAMDTPTDEQSEILYLWNGLDDFCKGQARTFLYGLSRQVPPLPDPDTEQ